MSSKSSPPKRTMFKMRMSAPRADEATTNHTGVATSASPGPRLHASLPLSSAVPVPDELFLQTLSGDRPVVASGVVNVTKGTTEDVVAPTCSASPTNKKTRFELGRAASLMPNKPTCTTKSSGGGDAEQGGNSDRPISSSAVTDALGAGGDNGSASGDGVRPNDTHNGSGVYVPRFPPRSRSSTSQQKRPRDGDEAVGRRSSPREAGARREAAAHQQAEVLALPTPSSSERGRDHPDGLSLSGRKAVVDDEGVCSTGESVGRRCTVVIDDESSCSRPPQREIHVISDDEEDNCMAGLKQEAERQEADDGEGFGMATTYAALRGVKNTQQHTQPNDDDELAALRLSDEQRFVAHLVLEKRRNVFITGGAGTGKSFLVKHIIRQSNRATTGVVAPTGVAAYQVGGQTTNRWFGFFSDDSKSKMETCQSMYLKGKRENLARCERLIIDEISMLEGSLFQALDHTARQIRKNNRPFGGIQLIFCGDFMQLPPINTRAKSRFVFETEAWRHANPRVCHLSVVFRQRDNMFIGMLNEIRRGELSYKHEKLLAGAASDTHIAFANETCTERENPLKPLDRLQLCCRKKGVAAVNSDQYCKLFDTPQGDNGNLEEYTFNADDSGKIADDLLLPKELTLCVGTRVMMITNVSVADGLVNGAVGVVCGFISTSTSGVDVDAIADLKRISPQRKFPVVEFELRCRYSEKKRKRRVIVEPHTWSTDGDAKLKSSRVQIPLVHAWAITIHKCQGMTLPSVKIDFSGCFDSGQAYVALSRASSFEQVVITNFDAAQCIKFDPTARRFYEVLEESGAGRCEPIPELDAAANPWGAADYDADDDWYHFGGNDMTAEEAKRAVLLSEMVNLTGRRKSDFTESEIARYKESKDFTIVTGWRPAAENLPLCSSLSMRKATPNSHCKKNCIIVIDSTTLLSFWREPNYELTTSFTQLAKVMQANALSVIVNDTMLELKNLATVEKRYHAQLLVETIERRARAIQLLQGGGGNELLRVAAVPNGTSAAAPPADGDPVDARQQIIDYCNLMRRVLQSGDREHPHAIKHITPRSVSAICVLTECHSFGQEVVQQGFEWCTWDRLLRAQL